MKSTVVRGTLLFLLVGPAVAHADSGGLAAPSSAPSQDGPTAVVSAGPAAHAGEPSPLRVRFVSTRGPVTARVTVRALATDVVAARAGLGAVPSGQEAALPADLTARLAAGRYRLRVEGRDAAGVPLRRTAARPGELTFTVTAARGGSQPGSASKGVFPVAGPFTYGEPFGAPRKGYAHQGQDMAAAAGTLVRTPRPGTVRAASYQAQAAGEYVVVDAGAESYVFAHCQRNSTAVAVGQHVAAGDTVCRVGSTGRSTGPHLHFEVWLAGWRSGPDSRPVDPLPRLRAWSL